MKIAAVTLAYNDSGVIAGTIKCLKDYVDQHFVIISEKPYFGEAMENDNTDVIAEGLGAEVIKGTWPLDHYQRNLGNSLADGYDWVLTFDSDEMMTRSELDKLMVFLKTADKDCYCVKPEIYWFNTDYVLRPIPEYCPVVFMRPHVRFDYIRNVRGEFSFYEGEMHHLSWCYPKDILKKVRHYAHATDFNGEEWYKNNYVGWREGQDAHLPTGVYQTLKKPLPEELRVLLNA